jgi:hypothetical protein
MARCNSRSMTQKMGLKKISAPYFRFNALDLIAYLGQRNIGIFYTDSTHSISKFTRLGR